MPATRTRKPSTRSAKVQTIGDSLILWLTVDRNTTAYRLTPLASDFGRAVRLQKADKGDGQTEEYDVLLAKDGFDSCECKGFLRWHHCKHHDAIKMLVSTNRI